MRHKIKNKFSHGSNNLVYIIVLFLSVSFFIGFFIWNESIYIKKSKTLYPVFQKGGYDNFQIIEKNDPLFQAITKNIEQNMKFENRNFNVDIAEYRFFSLYFKYYALIELDKNREYVERILIRRFPT